MRSSHQCAGVPWEGLFAKLICSKQHEGLAVSVDCGCLFNITYIIRKTFFVIIKKNSCALVRTPAGVLLVLNDIVCPYFHNSGFSIDVPYLSFTTVAN